MYKKNNHTNSITWRVATLLFLSLLMIVSLDACTLTEPGDDLPWEKSPEFNIESFQVIPSSIMIGESAVVAAKVSNSGDEAGTYTAILLKEGTEFARKDAFIEPGEEKIIDFQIPGTDAGSYRLSIERSNTIITIYNWSPYTIQYDSGISGGSYYVAGELGHIVHFIPQAKPFKIKKIYVYGTAELENPRELDTKQCTVRIWNSDKTKQLWTQDFPWRLFHGPVDWREIEVPDITVEDDFHVEIVTYSQQPKEELTNYITIGWNKPQPQQGLTASTAETNSGVSNNGVLVQSPESMYKGINWFIRADGEGAPRILQYDDGEDEEWHWTTSSHFVSFTPPASNYEVQKIKILGYVRVKDERHLTEKKFTLRIRDQASGNILWEQEYRWELFGLDRAKWLEIKTPGVICPGDFYVRLISNSIDEDNCIVIGVDSSSPNRHSYVSRDVLIQPGESRKAEGADYDSERANWMIRVEGVYR